VDRGKVFQKRIAPVTICPPNDNGHGLVPERTQSSEFLFDSCASSREYWDVLDKMNGWENEAINGRRITYSSYG
jgi:hypothetical protein